MNSSIPLESPLIINIFQHLLSLNIILIYMYSYIFIYFERNWKRKRKNGKRSKGETLQTPADRGARCRKLLRTLRPRIGHLTKSPRRPHIHLYFIEPWDKSQILGTFIPKHFSVSQECNHSTTIQLENLILMQ